MGGGERTWRRAALGLAFGLAATAPALAHPHVWVTVKSEIVFTPDKKVSAVIHDWVFDEMYSSFAVQGLAPPGKLVTRAEFAPLPAERRGPGRNRLLHHVEDRRQGGRFRPGDR